MSKFINVSDPKQTEWHNDRAVIKYTISRNNSSYFGYCNQYMCLAIRRASGYHKYWGFPIASQWKSSWGTPSWYLSSQSYIKNQFGNLQGDLFNSREFTDTIQIDRGNKRQGSKQVTVGVESGKNVGSNFGTTLKTITVYTSKIADASNVSLSVEVDPIDIKDRYIKVTGGFTNHENYYDMRLYRNGVQVPFTGEYIEEITKDLFFKNITFELKIFGKDGTQYNNLTQSKSVNIAPSGPGVYVKDNDMLNDVNSMLLNNVTHKEITEVWIKKNDKIYKTVK